MDRRTHGARLGDTANRRPSTAHRGEAYADEGTLILRSETAPHLRSRRSAPPPSARASAPPPSARPLSSHRPRLESWTEDRGNWALPTERPAHAPEAQTRKPNGALAMVGIGAVAFLATFAAVVAALGDPGAQTADAAKAPPAAVALGAAPQTVVVAPPQVTASEGGDPASTSAAAPRIIAPSPARKAPMPTTSSAGSTGSTSATTAAPAARDGRPTSGVTTSASTTTPYASKAKARAKAKAKAAAASSEAERKVLEDLLEQQLAR
jgi:hypothetical protein